MSQELYDEAEREGLAHGFPRWQRDIYNDAFLDAMCGTGEFWSSTAYDYYVQASDALRHACALVSATPAQRWAYVEGALSALAHEYALGVAERASQ